jgi:hypothetical protein
MNFVFKQGPWPLSVAARCWRRSNSTEIRQSPYGAAGSALIVVFMDYAGLISYFGADLTRVYTERFRSRSKAQTLFD